MIRFFAAAIAAVSAVVVHAGPPAVVVVPKAEGDRWVEVKAERGRLLTLAAEPASKWLLVDEDGADLKVFDSGKHAAFAAPADGRFKVIVTGPDGSAARVVVVVGDSPVPVPPPKDELREKLKAAFDAATDADKKTTVKDIAELYRQVAALAADPELTTAKKLLDRARDAAAVLLKPTQLVKVREVVAAELKSLFPADAELTVASRKAAAELFARLAEILDSF